MQAPDDVARRVVMIEAANTADALGGARRMVGGIEAHGAVGDRVAEGLRLTSLLEGAR